MRKTDIKESFFKKEEISFGADWPVQLPETLQSFLNYCQAKHQAGDKFLLRRDFDPLDVPKLMPNLQIIEEVPDETDRQGRCRLRWRLMGSAFHPAFQEKTRGRFLDEVLEANLYLELRETYDLMHADGQPSYLTARQQMSENNLYSYQRIIVPALTEVGSLHYIGCWHWDRGQASHP